MGKGLSKSRLMSFLQCSRKLWLEVYQPQLAQQDPRTEAVFANGHAVGAIARQLYDRGNGVEISYDSGLSAALTQTSEALRTDADPIFEATFDREDLLVRLDVLLGRSTNARIVEVKSSTSVKDEYLIDCAIQTWVTEANGIRPQSVALAHVDNQFVCQGDGNYAGLLAEEDITPQVASHIENVPLWKASADQILKGSEPSVPVGSHCRSPYVCPFIEHCWPQTEYPLDGLPGIGRRLNELVAAGYKDVRDVPSHLLKGKDQLRVLRAVRSGKSELLPGAEIELAALGWPRYYLDFETIGFAIPIWAGTRPYQALPFQWSLHIESARGQLEHAEFLDVSGAAPMRQCAEALIKAAGTGGPILTYTTFERQCIRTLQSFCPELASQLEALSHRLVDLHPIVKKHYYHPDMHGSWSIKAVLPTLVPEMQYGQLEGIHEGMGAQQGFQEAIDPTTTADRRSQLRDQLLAYCKFDTLAMVKVSQKLEGRG